MPMLAIAWFDFARRLRMISTYVYFVLFAVLAGLWMAAAGRRAVQRERQFRRRKVLINGPYALAFGIAFLGFAGVTVIGSVTGRAVQQDFEYGTYHFFFAAPIHKRDYFFGRLLGAYLTLVLIFVSIASGSSSARTGRAWIRRASSRTRRGKASFARICSCSAGMLWLGGCFSCSAALTRQMAPVYVAGVVLLVGYLFAINLLGDMENKTLAALVDPSGATGFDPRPLLERRAEEWRADSSCGRVAVESRCGWGWGS
jgi:hypothetical protein